MQPEADLMVHATLFSLPKKPVIRCTETASRLWAGEWQDHRLCAASAQIKASHTAGDLQRERLIDHDTMVSLRVLDGEDGAVRQDADRESVTVDDPHEAKIVLPRRHHDLCWQMRHCCSLDRFDLTAKIGYAGIGFRIRMP